MSRSLSPSKVSRRACVLAGAALAALATAVPAVRAHDNAYLATIRGAHGGQVRMAERYHFEVVVGDGELRVWVTDHADKPIATEGASASAVVLGAASRLSLDLRPSGANGLAVRDARIPAQRDARVALTVTMRGEPTLQLRFAPIQKPAEDDASETHHH